MLLFYCVVTPFLIPPCAYYIYILLHPVCLHNTALPLFSHPCCMPWVYSSKETEHNAAIDDNKSCHRYTQDATRLSRHTHHDLTRIYIPTHYIQPQVWVYFKITSSSICILVVVSITIVTTTPPPAPLSNPRTFLWYVCMYLSMYSYVSAYFSHHTLFSFCTRVEIQHTRCRR